tara:strand:+ start:19 stop:204 length:186 start_codon:yes stop_codon:yes gene_type:complete
LQQWYYKEIDMKVGDLVVFRKKVCIVDQEVQPYIWWISLLLPEGVRLVVHKKAVRLLDESR